MYEKIFVALVTDRVVRHAGDPVLIVRAMGTLS